MMFQNIQIFLILIFIAALALGVRSRDMFNDITQQPEAIRGALAQDIEEQDTESALDSDTVINAFRSPTEQDITNLAIQESLAQIEPAADDAAKEDDSTEQPAEDLDATQLGDAPAAPDSPEWRDHTDAELEYSGVQQQLFSDLSERRKDIERREKELVMREALLQAAQKEIEQKYTELDALRVEIENLLKKQSDEEEARIQSLVRIYEGMKAKDAARIFNTLETEVLLSVLGRMSERKSAPIIAAMNADRARSVTIMLAEQKKLPDLSDR